MPESAYPMIPVQEAVDIVLSNVHPLSPIRLPFDQALGYVLAEDVRAVEPMPPFAASGVDGYAVVAGDPSPIRRVLGEQTAGHLAGLQVIPQTAVRVTTGAPIPNGADAVVMVEDTEAEVDGNVRVNTAVEVGSNIRPVGQDVTAGQLVLAGGLLMGPAEVGLLAMTGQTEVSVFPRPRVGVMSTGDELVDPGVPLMPGQIRDSNRYTLMSAVRECGVAVDLGRISDRPQAVKNAIEGGLGKMDALLTAGGVSMGAADLVKPYLAQRGSVLFGRVRAKPGKPVTFGILDGVPVFAMPGFPVSALVCFEIYVRPALLKMAGHTLVQRPRRQVVLSHDIRHAPERTEFQRAVVTRHADGHHTAVTTGFQGSGRLLSMSRANALLILPHGRVDFPVGTEVEAIIIGPVQE